METDYTKRVQLTADDLLLALPWKLRKGFLTKEQIKREGEMCSVGSVGKNLKKTV